MGPEASAAKRARRFPPWIRKRIPAGDEAARVRRLLADLGLATVCSGAHCPNLAECYARGTATFLILGESCTRSCRFCAIPTADPGSPREDEPEAVAEAAARLGLRHVVVTSVTRDDLADGGAGHFARTIRAVRARLPQVVVEVLTPDFQGSRAALDAVLDARPDIFNHNVETAPRLYPAIRPEADYRRSLEVLAYVKRQAEARGLKTWTKSGLMMGLGETPDEVRGVLGDLREAGCDIVTIGQYLSPSAAHAPVARFVEPGEFEAWEAEARAMGFRAVASGPFVRSSYEAERVFQEGAAGSPRGLKTRAIFEPGAGAPG
jgi:lipoic acid synthetase